MLPGLAYLAMAVSIDATALLPRGLDQWRSNPGTADVAHRGRIEAATLWSPPGLTLCTRR